MEIKTSFPHYDFMRIKSNDDHEALRYSNTDPRNRTQKIIRGYVSANIFVSDVNSMLLAALLCRSLASINVLPMSSCEAVCSAFTNPFSSFLDFLFLFFSSEL